MILIPNTDINMYAFLLDIMLPGLTAGNAQCLAALTSNQRYHSIPAIPVNTALSAVSNE